MKDSLIPRLMVRAGLKNPQNVMVMPTSSIISLIQPELKIVPPMETKMGRNNWDTA